MLEQLPGRLLGLLQKAHVSAEIGQGQLRQAVLAASKEVAGAAQLQVLLGDLKAIGGGGQSFQPGHGVGSVGVGNEYTVGLVLAAAYPATELVELAEAKALRVLHDDERGVGYVYANLYYRGGYQHVHVPGGKGGHDGVLFPGAHFAVEQGQTQVWEHLVLEVLGVAPHCL